MGMGILSVIVILVLLIVLVYGTLALLSNPIGQAIAVILLILGLLAIAKRLDKD